MTLEDIETYRRNTSEHIGFNEELVSVSAFDSAPSSMRHSNSAGELSISVISQIESELSILERRKDRKVSFFGHGFGFHSAEEVVAAAS